MAVSKDNERIVTTVTKETVDIIRELADKEIRTVSAMAAILIEKGLKDYNK